MNNAVQTPAWRGSIWERFSPLSLGLIVALGGAFLLGITLGSSDKATTYAIYGVGGVFTLMILLFRFDELAVMFVMALHVYVDWFLGLHLAGVLLAVVLLFIFYFGRSAERPWIKPRLLPLWFLFLVLTIYPAIYGGQYEVFDFATFYPSIYLGSFLVFWLGTLIARETQHVRRLLQFLAFLATLLAIHTLIQAKTGVFLFGTQRVNDLLVQANNYQLAGSNATRAASFLIDPNWNATLLAMMAFLPLGLFFGAKSLFTRILYLVETITILVALLFTYSNGGWVGLGSGLVVFILLSGRLRWSASVVGVVLAFGLVLVLFFPGIINTQLLHASNPQEVILRVGIDRKSTRLNSSHRL